MMGTIEQRNGKTEMDKATQKLVSDLLKAHNGDTEKLARFMSRTLKIGTVSECLELIGLYS